MADRAVNLETVIGMVNTYFRNVLNLNPDLLIDGIVSLSTVDAVPVVRCAVCRYFLCNMRGDGTLPNGVDEFECVWGRGGYDPMDFCSEGERKDDDHEKTD